MGGQPSVNVRGVGERHITVRQTDSGFGVDAQVGPGRFPRDLTHLCLLGLFLMTFAMGGIPRAGSRQLEFKGIAVGNNNCYWYKNNRDSKFILCLIAQNCGFEPQLFLQ